MTIETLVNIAIIGSPILMIIALFWTIYWSKKVRQIAQNDELTKQITRLVSSQQRTATKLDEHERRLDQMPTAATIERMNGDIRTVLKGMEGLGNQFKGLGDWMARMDSYLHGKD